MHELDEPFEPHGDLSGSPEPSQPAGKVTLYRVGALTAVMGHPPYSVFAATIDPQQERRLVDSGFLTIVQPHRRRGFDSRRRATIRPRARSMRDEGWIDQMQALEADYYDHAIADETSPHLLPADEGPYAALFAAVVARLAEQPPAHLIDLGCGAGRFAALVLPQTGRTLSYTGYDFSQGMIDEAWRYNGDDNEDPDILFARADLREAHLDLYEWRPAVIVCLETLEHLDNDLRLLGRLPVDARLIISVPSFDSRAHVRHFPHVADALARYGEILDIDTWQRVWLPERTGYFHLITGKVQP